MPQWNMQWSPYDLLSVPRVLAEDVNVTNKSNMEENTEKKENLTPLFVYGTLTSVHQREYLGVQAKNLTGATLKGFYKEGLNILHNESEEVYGQYFEVNDEELAHLDFYEGIEWGLYERIEVEVETEEGKKPAQVYRLINKAWNKQKKDGKDD